MSDSNQPSTLQSYVDTATGKVQDGLGSLTGNTGDQAKGNLRQDKAHAEYDASHATAKVPGGTISGSGAAVRDDSDRTQGSWNQTVGSAKEALGGLIGNEVCVHSMQNNLPHLILTKNAQSLKSTGRQQNLEGQQQEAKGQLNDLGSGVAGRVQGAVGSAVSGLTGDGTGKSHYEQMRAEGKTQQRGVEHDLQKKAEGENI